MPKLNVDKDIKKLLNIGAEGANHQQATSAEHSLTTNQGTVVSDDQNMLKSGARGPSLLEDFHFREKTTHFDQERIPERIVHARGSGAHGFFEVTHVIPNLTKASFLSKVGKKTEVFARFSTVAGGAGSGDLARDVRGFSVKFYTDEGNYDLVGNNIPVFFIQDALKFPDLIHSVKMEPDRGYPQAASAHDTFWDFVSLMPESMHMIMWVMSDRAIPRSLRMIEGFGIHTFRMINDDGESTFVKFHWRPKLGAVSVLWDEAVKINGADSDFHRRDLYEAIAKGNFPEWEFGVQALDQKQADALDFDILDSTKLIPEETIPIQILGRMVLDRNPTNYFAETEQVAFHPGHVVPGIDFSNDPLLQGRLFSYTDTQLSRLGGPNFHEIPINRPRCPMRNLQRDGIARMDAVPGRVSYEPNSLDPAGPREDPKHGFQTFAPQRGANESGDKLRVRADSFGDHYSQARQFYKSMTVAERNHIVSALSFELSKVETLGIRQRMLGHLHIVHAALATAVEEKLGMKGQATDIKPFREPIDLKVSPALSLIAKAKPTLAGRKVGILVSDGVDQAILISLRAAVEAEHAQIVIVAHKVGGVMTRDGKKLAVDMALSGAPSAFFDALCILVSPEGADEFLKIPVALDWLRDGFVHLKVIGFTSDAGVVIKSTGITEYADGGVVDLNSPAQLKSFITHAKNHRMWTREILFD